MRRSFMPYTLTRRANHTIEIAANLDADTVDRERDELDRDQPVFTICQMGKTSYQAARLLAQHGFDARAILGGANHLLD